MAWCRGSGQHHQRALGLTFPAHNPKVVSSNLTPATMGAARLNLKAPLFLLVACRVVTLPCSVRHCNFVPIPKRGTTGERISADCAFRSATLAASRSDSCEMGFCVAIEFLRGR